MNHDPLCPKWFDTVSDQIECPTCDLLTEATRRGRRQVLYAMDEAIETMERKTRGEAMLKDFLIVARNLREWYDKPAKAEGERV